MIKKISLLFVTSFLLTACTGTPTSTDMTPTTAPTMAATSSADASPSAESKKMMMYTMAEVAMHKTPSDCWFVINDMVLDVSNFGTKHPGGEAVYAGCGKDATAMFTTRANGEKHSEKAWSFLPNFQIGTLSK